MHLQRRSLVISHLVINHYTSRLSDIPTRRLSGWFQRAFNGSTSLPQIYHSPISSTQFPSLQLTQGQVVCS